MLVLTRRSGEAIRIGDDIEVTLLEVRGDTVKIGIDAPRSTTVWRKELWEEIVAENLRAAKQTVPQDMVADLLGKNLKK